jgi:hypothetical protein
MYNVYCISTTPDGPIKTFIINGDLRFAQDYVAVHEGTWWEKGEEVREPNFQYVCSITNVPFRVAVTLDEAKKWFANVFTTKIDWYEATWNRTWQDQKTSVRIDRVRTIGG